MCPNSVRRSSSTATARVSSISLYRTTMPLRRVAQRKIRAPVGRISSRRDLREAMQTALRTSSDPLAQVPLWPYPHGRAVG
jgi:hypothetical protein